MKITVFKIDFTKTPHTVNDVNLTIFFFFFTHLCYAGNIFNFFYDMVRLTI